MLLKRDTQEQAAEPQEQPAEGLQHARQGTVTPGWLGTGSSLVLTSPARQTLLTLRRANK